MGPRAVESRAVGEGRGWDGKDVAGAERSEGGARRRSRGRRESEARGVEKESEE
jgi:hypothetical protein